MHITPFKMTQISWPSQKNAEYSSQIQNRVFIVGCPRSGTTLLQGLLTAHPKIISFPESHFFSSLIIPKWSHLLGIGSPQARQKLDKLISHLALKNARKLPEKTWRVSNYIAYFTALLDNAALAGERSIWIEKSPEHLHQISFIEKHVPNAKFIHIVRNGSDVVASLYDVAAKYQQQWDGPWSIERCVHWWVRDVKTSLKHHSKDNHLVIKYETLVIDTERQLSELCQFLEVDFDSVMLKEYQSTKNQIVKKDEPWKAAVDQNIQNLNSQKFYNLFDESQRDYILKSLKEAFSSQELAEIQNI
jgi:hypothetical protein